MICHTTQRMMELKLQYQTYEVSMTRKQHRNLSLKHFILHNQENISGPFVPLLVILAVTSFSFVRDCTLYIHGQSWPYGFNNLVLFM